MAQEWFSKDALDAQLQHIITGCDSGSAKVVLLKAYTAGDDFTTVHVTNNIGEAVITGAGDFSAIADGTPASSRRMSFTGANGTASASDSGGTLWIALVDVTGTEVLAVTDETSDQTITSGNPLTFPTFYMQANQPIAAV